MAETTATAGAEAAAKEQRKRYPERLPKPGSGEQPFAKKRTELKKVSAHEVVLWITETPEWASFVRPELEALDRERADGRKDARGGKPAYSAEEIEKALLYGKVKGFRTYIKTHAYLCADRYAREALGFTRPNHKKAVRFQDGVPSRATVSRHLRRFGKQRRADMWDKFWRLLRDRHVIDFPEMLEEMLESYLDGTILPTHYTCPIYDPVTGELVNEDDITCPDGGYRGKDAGEGKSGHGWNKIPLLTRTGVPWAEVLPKIHESEKTEAAKLLMTEARQVLDLVPERKLGVGTADGGFDSPNVRRAFREIGFIENIHTVSHKEDSKPRAASERKRRIPIEGYPNWFSDGHRQLVCKCGEGKTFRRVPPLSKKGKATCRVEGRCKNCGAITITSGAWRLHKNSTEWTRVNPKDPKAVAKADLLFGNPLTFDDPIANAYGNGRFGRNEGMFGTVWKRWRLGHKRWYRTVHDYRAEIGMIYSIIHVVAMEQRRRKVELELPDPLEDT
jgi:hypothetical protein